LGATTTGIFVLSGAKDNGTNISAHFKTGSMDFGDTFKKFLRQIWLSFRSLGVIKFTFYTDEDTTTQPTKSTQIKKSTIVEEVIKPPRGLKGRWYTILVENQTGASFDIDYMSMLVESIKRLVR